MDGPLLRRYLPPPTVLAALGFVAVLVRIHGITDPIFTFHPTRQYRSAIIARDCLLRYLPETPEVIRKVAAANRSMQPAGEPPILEWAACAAFRTAGRESLAIPRALSIAAWAGSWRSKKT